MEKQIALFISKVFNPLVFVVFFLAITFNIQFYISSSIPQNARWMILGLVTITTFVIPALMGNILLRLLISKFNMRKRDAKLIPLAIAAVLYIFTYHLLDRVNLSPIFNLFILGMASLAIISMLIMMKYEISIYMIAAGALPGGFTGLHLTLNVNMSFYIMLSVILGGIIGFSRLYLDKHKPHEIYVGFIMGALVMLAHYLYL
ncbi:MAG: hypothetical protein K9H16_04210 [Bacteroidales bacterium]|nr:hypothetical protein [Bacteroidales bacterium]